MSDEHDEHDPGHVEYGLLYPFVVCDDHGGPYPSEAFVAGVRFGNWQTMLKVRPHQHQSYEPPALVPQLDLLAMHEGYTMTTKPWSDDWTLVTFTLGGPDDQNGPTDG